MDDYILTIPKAVTNAYDDFQLWLQQHGTYHTFVSVCSPTAPYRQHERTFGIKKRRAHLVKDKYRYHTSRKRWYYVHTDGKRRFLVANAEVQIILLQELRRARLDGRDLGGDSLARACSQWRISRKICRQAVKVWQRDEELKAILSTDDHIWKRVLRYSREISALEKRGVTPRSPCTASTCPHSKIATGYARCVRYSRWAPSTKVPR